MRKTFFLVWAFPLLLGCSHAKSDETPRVSPPRPSETPFQITSRTEDGCTVASQDEAFKCLTSRCQNAGGEYDPKKQTCTCPNNETFVSWGKGYCRPLSKPNSCLNRNGGFSIAALKGENELEKCWDLGTTGRTGMIVVPSFSENTQEKAEWGDYHASLFRDHLRHLPVLFTSYTEEWVIGKDYFQSLSESRILDLASTPRIPLNAVAEIETPGRLFYVANAQDLENAFTRKEGELDLGPAPYSNPLLLKLESAVRKAEQTTGKPSYQFYTEDGCAGHCESSQEIKDANNTVTRELKFAGGRKISDRIVLWDSETRSQAVGMAFLLPSGQVSHFLTVSSVKGGNFSEVELEVWDKNFSPLLKRPVKKTVVHEFEALKNAIQSLPSWTNAANEPKAVVCESGFDDKTINFLGAKNILKGPHALAPSAGSSVNLLGWMSSSPSSNFNAHNASAVLPLSSLGLRIPFAPFQEHARRVSQILMGNEKDISLIPIAADHCAVRVNEWLGAVKAARAAVVNFSAVTDYTPEACKNSPMGKAILSHPEILFVVASGNDGVDYGSNLPNYCPQNLRGAKNLIVVGATSGTLPASNSNKGNKFVDLFADGSHLEEGPQSYATSFATPRVARVAALLHEAYPTLSASDIRRVLLLSADISKNYWGNFSPLPARSGGTLNEERARRFGLSLTKNPDQTAEELLKSEYCWFGRPCEEASFHYEIFKQNSGGE